MPDGSKPPYRIPPTAEIVAGPSNGLRAADLFSGCGGTALGLRWAGYELLYAAELADVPRASYAANLGHAPDAQDVRELTAERLMERAGVGEGELDLLAGSPPCTAFSMAGKRQKGWRVEAEHAGKVQRVDDLFLEFARLVDGVRPRAFAAENVTGLVRGAAKGYFKMIHRALTECGYRVAAGVLDASYLGVPQARQRLYIVGLRDDLGRDPELPRPLPYRYTVRDALAGIEGIRTSRGVVPAGEPAPTVQTHGRPSTQSELTPVLAAEHEAHRAEADISRYAIGPEWDSLRPGDQSERYFSLQRAHPDRPCPTVTAAQPDIHHGMPIGAATVTHPAERRKFTIAELRRLSGLPDDYVLEGSYGQQWAQCGNIVVPPMARAVGEALARGLKGE